MNQFFIETIFDKILLTINLISYLMN